MARSTVRQSLGAWYTPPELVETVTAGAITAEFVDRRMELHGVLRVLDPACGDGRFLAAARLRVEALGGVCELVGVDIDPAAVLATTSGPSGAVAICDDALTRAWNRESFDLVIGNPPFLSQMSSVTSRGGSSTRGGGPYADAAAEFLALAAELVDADGGRVAFVIPQSLLAARDAAEMRLRFDERAAMIWSWWTGEQVFDAQVHTCAVAFEFGPRARTQGAASDRTPAHIRGQWAHVITDRLGVPELDVGVAGTGVLGDRARLNANFRDEYYGMAPAVTDEPVGPPLITSGLIDPGRVLWGERPVTFAKRRYLQPRLDLDLLDAKMRRWASKRLVPKVLVANQTRIVEAVCDPSGQWLPAVPVIGIYPHGTEHASEQNESDVTEMAWAIAAILTSPIASAWVWHRNGGTGMSARSVRVSPSVLAGLPWPSGDLTAAVDALRDHDVRACGVAVIEAYHLDRNGEALVDWWIAALATIEARQ